MKKTQRSILAIGGVIALTATLAACSSVAEGDTNGAPSAQEDINWEPVVRAGVRAQFENDPSAAEGCEGFEMMGIETPQDFVDFIVDIGEPGASLEETMSAFAGESLDPSDLPGDVSMEEVVLVAADEILDFCAV